MVQVNSQDLIKMRKSLDAGLGKSKKIRQLPIGGKVEIIRNHSGVYLFGIACVAVLNRVNEIDSRALFDDFIYRQKMNNQWPSMLFGHVPQLRIGQVTQTFRQDFTYIAIAKFDLSNRLARMLINDIENEANYWGMSVGYIPHDKPELVRVQDDQFVECYNSGSNHEISIVPEAHAASHFTGFNLMKGVKK